MFTQTIYSPISFSQGASQSPSSHSLMMGLFFPCLGGALDVKFQGVKNRKSGHISENTVDVNETRAMN